ncbi:DMT family transporter [Bacillus sp. HMF5848]|uniref:DMT family transporter n=1 Tax=Bacillus sp. HMF5848 TaxID=2495421 RepID=UPI000F79BE93|nr:DMT family transporter [Bacillus sp. HMF5848]RSK28107.1 DMT family transporter [Bacillus sp. HMF5848]
MSKWKLYVLLTTVMAIWGLNVVAIKLLVSYFPASLMQGMRVLLAGVVVILLLYVNKQLKKVSKKNIMAMFIAGIFGVFAHHLFLALGLTTSTAANGGLILGLVPLSTAVLAVIFLKERLTVAKVIGITLALIGIYIMQGRSLAGITLGDIYLFAAVLAQAISFILIKKMTDRVDSRQMTGMMLVSGSVLLLTVSPFLDNQPSFKIIEVPLFVWFVFVLSAVLATSMGHMLYNYAIHRLGAAETSIFNNLTPLFALVGASVLLQETIHTEQIVGFIFIVSGVMLGTGTLEVIIRSRRVIKET